MKTILIPFEQRKRTTFSRNIYYDKLEIQDDRVDGYFEGNLTMTWRFQDYIGIEFIRANINSQFAQVVFLNGLNAKKKAIGIDFRSSQNLMALSDINRILFCSGMFSFSKTNSFAMIVANEIQSAFYQFRNKEFVKNGAYSAPANRDAAPDNRDAAPNAQPAAQDNAQDRYESSLFEDEAENNANDDYVSPIFGDDAQDNAQGYAAQDNGQQYPARSNNVRDYIVPESQQPEPELEQVEPELEQVEPELEQVEPEPEQIEPELEEIEPEPEQPAQSVEQPAPKQSAAAGGKPAYFSVADELLKFKQLLDMGVLTQEEFDAQKKQLLGM